jgi:DNA-binding LytR/AlgR family response regulator
MVHIGIVEDDEMDRGTLEQYFCKFKQEKGTAFEIDYFSDGLQFIEDYVPDFDIIFMDIQMPHVNGLEAAKRLRTVDESVCLIFVTSMAQYAICGYEVGAMNFLLKPIQYHTFCREMEKALRKIGDRKQDALLLTAKEGHVRVERPKIYYVESEKHYLCFHTSDGEYHVRGTLGEWEELIQNRDFFRCSQSYLVNMAHVSRILSNTVLIGGDEIPISRSKKKEFMDAFTNYLGGQ